MGTAYIHGFKWALAKDIILYLKWMLISRTTLMIFPLYDACKNGGADIAIGSRYVKGGGVVNWPRNRIALSKGGSLYTRMITWMPVKDPTAGFMCYKREVLEAINLDEIDLWVMLSRSK